MNKNKLIATFILILLSFSISITVFFYQTEKINLAKKSKQLQNDIENARIQQDDESARRRVQLNQELRHLEEKINADKQQLPVAEDRRNDLEQRTADA